MNSHFYTSSILFVTKHLLSSITGVSLTGGDTLWASSRRLMTCWSSPFLDTNLMSTAFCAPVRFTSHTLNSTCVSSRRTCTARTDRKIKQSAGKHWFRWVQMKCINLVHAVWTSGKGFEKHGYNTWIAVSFNWEADGSTVLRNRKTTLRSICENSADPKKST